MLNLGTIEVVEQKGCQLPQHAASAWAAFDGQMTGAGYKPVAFVGTQVVKGTNYVFIAEQTLILAQPERHLVLVTVNEFEGKYTPAGIEQII